jgi:hypothetical protein
VTNNESAKQRARRIPLDYYQRLTGLDAAKWLLATLASIGVGAYVLWTLSGWLVGTPGSARQFSPGPVASSHAAWDADCAACHVTGTNLRHDAKGISLVSSLVRMHSAGDHSQIDARCQSCHSGELHHASQIASEVRSCAGCHHDHQGRDADLKRVADAVCTACHANIKAHRQPDAKSVLGEDQPITAFPADHPPFRSLATTDPGKLKFNHRLHMLPGQYAKGSKATGQKKLSDIPEPYRERLVYPRSLADVPADEVIQLDCADCHVPDDAAQPATPTSTASVPAAGAYMQPISFERHCAACHTGDLVAEVQGVAKQLPHGIDAAAIREILAGLVSPLAGPPRISPSQPLVKIPGRTLGENLAQTTELDAATRVAAAAVVLMKEGSRCGKCHTHVRLEAQANPPLPAEVVRPNLPSVWLPHARFDHAAHRAMQCFDCHDRNRLVTDQAGVQPGLDDPAPVIADIDTCKQCHAPASKWGTPGARHDCAACHKYHGGQRPPHGRGDPGRGVPVDQRHKGGEWMRRG